MEKLKIWCEKCKKFHKAKPVFSPGEGLWNVFIPPCEHAYAVARGHTKGEALERLRWYQNGEAHLENGFVVAYEHERKQ